MGRRSTASKRGTGPRSTHPFKHQRGLPLPRWPHPAGAAFPFEIAPNPCYDHTTMPRAANPIPDTELSASIRQKLDRRFGKP